MWFGIGLLIGSESLAEVGRLCGIDYGTKRIGLSVSDPDRLIASPWVTLTVDRAVDKQVQAVLTAVEGEFEIVAWVVGLPLNMDGSEGLQANTTRKFAEQLALHSAKEVHLWDERLSSKTADLYLAEGELTRKKKKQRRDRVAAQIILQCYLDARQNRDTDSDS